MSGIQQMLTGGTYSPALPTVIGQAYGGGFYAGKISTTADGVATHYLIVAPKASGEAAKAWGPWPATTGITSDIDGPTNSASLAALGSSYEAAVFAEGLTIGGYNDWYLPAKNELEVLYYFLKPTTDANNTSSTSGVNANAVSPEPISTEYTSGSPAQTSANGFITGQTNAFVSDDYWSSTEGTANNTWKQEFPTGRQAISNKAAALYVRAVRRIAV
jgi:hypothetical protein